MSEGRPDRLPVDAVIADAVLNPGTYTARNAMAVPAEPVSGWTARAVRRALFLSGYVIGDTATARLGVALVQRESVAGMPSEGPYPATIDEVAQEMARAIGDLEWEIPGLRTALAGRLLGELSADEVRRSVQDTIQPWTAP